jgi:hypothetical protein
MKTPKSPQGIHPRRRKVHDLPKEAGRRPKPRLRPSELEMLNRARAQATRAQFQPARPKNGFEPVTCARSPTRTSKQYYISEWPIRKQEDFPRFNMTVQ